MTTNGSGNASFFAVVNAVPKGRSILSATATDFANNTSEFSKDLVIQTAFDFGPSSSPLASGYTRVTESTAYSAAQGYGWLPGSSIYSYDRGTGGVPIQDFDYTVDATFELDRLTPNATYSLAVTLGDPGVYLHDNQQVIANGVLLGSVTTQPGQDVIKTYSVTADANGVLKIEFKKGPNSSDPFVCIAALSLH